MSEIWTAKERVDKDGEEMILFDVLDETTQETREQRLYTSALPLMFMLGGYPGAMGMIMALHDLPWRLRKIGESIFLDGPSIGDPTYHPIDPPSSP